MTSSLRDISTNQVKNSKTAVTFSLSCQPLFDIMQELKRNAEGFGIATQGRGRLRIPMIIRTAAHKQSMLCGKRLQKTAYLF